MMVWFVWHCAQGTIGFETVFLCSAHTFFNHPMVSPFVCILFILSTLTLTLVSTVFFCTDLW